jgi:glycosyltransferase involved in cell wall biosynthesis
MEKSPRISIVMPSYNQSRFIEEAIQSILEQDYPCLEFMILDGGSTDGSREIIQQYADRLGYWHSRPDRGQTDALIQGFERATGDLWGWVNSDDVLLPGALQAIAQAYHRHAECGLFGGNFIIIDMDSRILRCKRYPAQAARFGRHGLFALCQPGSFFKPQDYLAAGGLDVDLYSAMDADLYFRMFLNGTRYAYANTWLAGFRMHRSSKTLAAPEKHARESKLIQQRMWPGMRSNLFWQSIYRAWQVTNLNYLRMSLETLLRRGRHWRDWTGK